MSIFLDSFRTATRAVRRLNLETSVAACRGPVAALSRTKRFASRLRSTSRARAPRASQKFGVLGKSMELQDQSDRELLSDVAKLIGSHREVTAKLVACLAEIEERRLHLQAGFSSMF